MAENLLEDIALHLEFEGFGQLPDIDQDGDIYYGKLPDKPDAAIGVLSRDAGYSGSSQGARIQLIVRGNSTDESFEKAVKITETLHDFIGFLAGDRASVNIVVENGPAGIGADIKNREMYSINLRVYYC
ncbi:MAG: hypothetical protein GX483_08995 [Actinomycetaceae bacterium]|nr:hypothetical protein [Actinomycetaceae bacterium]